MIINPYRFFTLNNVLEAYAPYLAFSFEALPSFTGNTFIVRRASDNATQTIGTVAGGLVDTAAIAAFCGASDGFVTTAHGRGSARNMTQTTAANQPQIYTGATSSIVTESGKQCMIFNGDWLTHTNTTTVAVGEAFSFYVELSVGAVSSGGEFAASLGSVGLDCMSTEAHRASVNSAGVVSYAPYNAPYNQTTTIPTNTLYKIACSFDGTSVLKSFSGGRIATTVTGVAHDGFGAKTARVGTRVDAFSSMNGFVRSAVIWDGLIPDAVLAQLTN